MSTLDEDAARAVLDDPELVQGPVECLLAALAGCVRPDPPQTLDRDALIAYLRSGVLYEWAAGARESRDLADGILALLRPVEGFVLTREEAAYARKWLPIDYSQRARTLAARLDAAS